MRKKIIFLIILLSVFLVVPKPVSAAKTQKQKQNAYAIIVTSQPKGVFKAVPATGKRVFKEWKLHIFVRNEKENHRFRVIKDGKTIMSGSFSNTFHYTEKKVMPKIHIAKLRIFVDGNKIFSAKNFAVMKKTVGKPEIEKATEKKTVKIGAWEFTQTKLIYSSVGAIAALGAMFFMRIMVKRKLENEILEGF